MAKRKGYKVPKGASLTDSEYRPGFLTAEEARDFMREKNLYNRRVQARVRKYRGLIPEGAEISDLEIRQTGMTGVKWRGTLKDLKSRGEFVKAMELFAGDKGERSKYSKKPKARGSPKDGPTVKEKRAKNLRETTFDVIAEGFGLNEREERRLREMLESMSVDDIIRWRFNNPDIVRDFFERYKHYKETGEVDPKDRRKALKRLFDSLETGEPVEEERPPEYTLDETLERLKKLVKKGGPEGEEAAKLVKEMEAMRRRAERLLRMLR